jgi:hypothetical protein
MIDLVVCELLTESLSKEERKQQSPQNGNTASIGSHDSKVDGIMEGINLQLSNVVTGWNRCRERDRESPGGLEGEGKE